MSERHDWCLWENLREIIKCKFNEKAILYIQWYFLDSKFYVEGYVYTFIKSFFKYTMNQSTLSIPLNKGRLKKNKKEVFLNAIKNSE